MALFEDKNQTINEKTYHSQFDPKPDHQIRNPNQIEIEVDAPTTVDNPKTSRKT